MDSMRRNNSSKFQFRFSERCFSRAPIALCALIEFANDDFGCVIFQSQARTLMKLILVQASCIIFMFNNPPTVINSKYFSICVRYL